MADKIITANREHPEPVKPISEDINKLNEFVNKRVDSMRIDSTVYKYYVNTPLNELKSKEEKAIKREITRRQMEALNETDYPSTKPVGMKPNLINYVPNYNVNNSTKETIPDEFIIKDGNKVSDHEGGDPCPPKVVDALSSISDKISTVANKIYKAFDVTSDGFKSAIQHAKDKVKTLTHKVESSDVNSIAKTAGYGALLILAIASVWYFYKKYQKKKEANSKDVMASESNMMYMDKLISIYSILEENAPIKSTTNADKDIKLSAIRGKDNVLINNLCNRAKFVSSSLISDKDFVSFAKKANPEVLSYMKAINKVNNKEKEKN